MMSRCAHKLLPVTALVKGLSVVVCLGMATEVYAEDKMSAEKEAEASLESLFYSKNEIRNIKEAYISYLNQGSDTKSGGDVSASEYYDKAAEIKKLRSESRYFTYPQFFLESLVFHSDIDWSIWISGRKITADYPGIEGEIQVTEIDKDRVSFEWTPYDIEKVKEVWAKWPNDEVVVNMSEGTVNFSLLPNQTFSSYVMRVLEGKVLPVTIDRKEIEEDFKPPVSVMLPDKSPPTAPVVAEEDGLYDKPLNQRSLSNEFIGLFDN